jgi:hypothetical protein
MSAWIDHRFSISPTDRITRFVFVKKPSDLRVKRQVGSIAIGQFPLLDLVVPLFIFYGGTLRRSYRIT